MKDPSHWPLVSVPEAAAVMLVQHTAGLDVSMVGGSHTPGRHATGGDSRCLRPEHAALRISW